MTENTRFTVFVGAGPWTENSTHLATRRGESFARHKSKPGLALVLLMYLVAAAAPVAALPEIPQWSYRSLEPSGVAGPALPTGQLAQTLELVADDGTAEGAFGVSAATSRPFLWLQGFAPAATSFDLEEIWVLFPQDPQIAPGAPIQLVVYRDLDADPATGAELLATFDVTVEVADGATFSVYPLPAPVAFRGGGQIYLGVVSRFAISGVTPPTQPAAIDTSSSGGLSWVATWTSDPPDPPLLPPDQSLFPIDLLVPGNWMIRGLGTLEPTVDVPALDTVGLALLAALLALLGWRKAAS